MGCAIRVGGPTFGWPTDRQRTDPDPGDHRLDRGRQRRHDGRSLTCAETNAGWKGRSRRRAGGKDRCRSEGRYTGAIAGGEDGRCGRGGNTWQGRSPTDLVEVPRHVVDDLKRQ